MFNQVKSWLQRLPLRFRPAHAAAAGAVARPQILKPYTSDHDTARVRRLRRVVFVALTIFCFFYGAAFALFAPALIPMFAMPPVILLALAFWAAPDVNALPVRTLESLFFVFVATAVLWPNYLAVSLPGLPWITLQRLVGIPLNLVFLVCLSTNSRFRSDLAGILSSTPWILRILITLILFQFFSIFLSASKFFSITRFIVDQSNWTLMFFLSAYVFSRPGRASTWGGVLWTCALVLAPLAFWEWKLRHVLWAGHIPSFLKIEDQAVQMALTANFRLSGQYRAQTTFTGPLQFAEFLALTLPYIVHFAFFSRSRAVKILAFASMPVMIATFLVNGSRSGSIGLLATTFLYPLYLTLRRWKANPKSLVFASALWSYPIGVGVGGALILLVDGLRLRLLGGGGVQYSNMARQVQWSMGIPKILHNPLGYGIGRAAETLQYYTEGGYLTIDSYYLSMILELGVLGFLVYFGLFVYTIIYGSYQVYKNIQIDSEISLLVPTIIGLISFVAIKANFSEESNHALFFISLGLMTALLHRLRQDTTGGAPARGG